MSDPHRTQYQQQAQQPQPGQHQPIASTPQSTLYKVGGGVGMVLLLLVIGFFFLPLILTMLMGLFIYVVVPLLALLGLYQLYTLWRHGH